MVTTCLLIRVCLHPLQTDHYTYVIIIIIHVGAACDRGCSARSWPTGHRDGTKFIGHEGSIYIYIILYIYIYIYIYIRTYIRCKRHWRWETEAPHERKQKAGDA